MWDEAGRRQLLKGELRWEGALTYSYARRFGDALETIQPLRRQNPKDPKLLLFAGQLQLLPKTLGPGGPLLYRLPGAEPQGRRGAPATGRGPLFYQNTRKQGRGPEGSMARS